MKRNHSSPAKSPSAGWKSSRELILSPMSHKSHEPDYKVFEDQLEDIPSLSLVSPEKECAKYNWMQKNNSEGVSNVELSGRLKQAKKHLQDDTSNNEKEEKLDDIPGLSLVSPEKECPKYNWMQKNNTEGSGNVELRAKIKEAKKVSASSTEKIEQLDDIPCLNLVSPEKEISESSWMRGCNTKRSSDEEVSTRIKEMQRPLALGISSGGKGDHINDIPGLSFVSSEKDCPDYSWMREDSTKGFITEGTGSRVQGEKRPLPVDTCSTVDSDHLDNIPGQSVREIKPNTQLTDEPSTYSFERRSFRVKPNTQSTDEPSTFSVEGCSVREKKLNAQLIDDTTTFVLRRSAREKPNMQLIDDTCIGVRGSVREKKPNAQFIDDTFTCNLEKGSTSEKKPNIHLIDDTCVISGEKISQLPKPPGSIKREDKNAMPGFIVKEHQGADSTIKNNSTFKSDIKPALPLTNSSHTYSLRSILKGENSVNSNALIEKGLVSSTNKFSKSESYKRDTPAGLPCKSTATQEYNTLSGNEPSLEANAQCFKLNTLNSDTPYVQIQVEKEASKFQAKPLLIKSNKIASDKVEGTGEADCNDIGTSDMQVIEEDVELSGGTSSDIGLATSHECIKRCINSDLTGNLCDGEKHVEQATNSSLDIPLIKGHLSDKGNNDSDNLKKQAREKTLEKTEGSAIGIGLTVNVSQLKEENDDSGQEKGSALDVENAVGLDQLLQGEKGADEMTIGQKQNDDVDDIGHRKTSRGDGEKKDAEQIKAPSLDIGQATGLEPQDEENAVTQTDGSSMDGSSSSKSNGDAGDTDRLPEDTLILGEADGDNLEKEILKLCHDECIQKNAERFCPSYDDLLEDIKRLFGDGDTDSEPSPEPAEPVARDDMPVVDEVSTLDQFAPILSPEPTSSWARTSTPAPQNCRLSSIDLDAIISNTPERKKPSLRPCKLSSKLRSIHGGIEPSLEEILESSVNLCPVSSMGDDEHEKTEQAIDDWLDPDEVESHTEEYIVLDEYVREVSESPLEISDDEDKVLDESEGEVLSDASTVEDSILDAASQETIAGAVMMSPRSLPDEFIFDGQEVYTIEESELLEDDETSVQIVADIPMNKATTRSESKSQRVSSAVTQNLSTKSSTSVAPQNATSNIKKEQDHISKCTFINNGERFANFELTCKMESSEESESSVEPAAEGIIEAGSNALPQKRVGGLDTSFSAVNARIASRKEQLKYGKGDFSAARARVAVNARIASRKEQLKHGKGNSSAVKARVAVNARIAARKKQLEHEKRKMIDNLPSTMQPAQSTSLFQSTDQRHIVMQSHETETPTLKFDSSLTSASETSLMPKQATLKWDSSLTSALEAALIPKLATCTDKHKMSEEEPKTVSPITVIQGLKLQPKEDMREFPKEPRKSYLTSLAPTLEVPPKRTKQTVPEISDSQPEVAKAQLIQSKDHRLGAPPLKETVGQDPVSQKTEVSLKSLNIVSPTNEVLLKKVSPNQMSQKTLVQLKETVIQETASPENEVQLKTTNSQNPVIQKTAVQLKKIVSQNPVSQKIQVPSKKTVRQNPVTQNTGLPLKENRQRVEDDQLKESPAPALQEALIQSKEVKNKVVAEHQVTSEIPVIKVSVTKCIAPDGGLQKKAHPIVTVPPTKSSDAKQVQKKPSPFRAPLKAPLKAPLSPLATLTNIIAPVVQPQVRREAVITHGDKGKDVMERWESAGIPSPEVNLTCASYWRRRKFQNTAQAHRAHLTPSILEGNKMLPEPSSSDCTTLGEKRKRPQEAQGSRGGSFAKFQKTGRASQQAGGGPEMEARRREMNEVIQRKREEIQEEHKQLINQLWRSCAQEKEALKQDHNYQLDHLHHQQNIEQMRMNVIPDPYVRHMQEEHLRHDHMVLSNQLAATQRDEMKALEDSYLSRVQEASSAQRQAMNGLETNLSQQGEAEEIFASSVEYVNVTLAKAPDSRDPRTEEQCCLPRNVAMEIVAEDNVYASFYSFR